MHPRSLCLALFVCALTLGACTKANQPASSEPGSEQATPSDASVTDEPASGDIAGSGPVGKELPPELVGDLRLQGSDADGRLLTLASGFIATAECSDCGAPNYLWFLAVRCADTRHCEILTEQCEGKVSREDQTFVLDLRPVEGGSPELCAGYSGTFELP